ncbi:hypothetical protein [Streptomyces halstedii]|uniref:hypothetical protein n=1 Tax=Streptomyces halstedii TaxID=1944 RepID=UPI003814A1AC
MNPTLTTATTPLPATDEQYQLLDMREVWEELAAALHHIENLPRQHPYEASGYTREPVYQPTPPGTHSHRTDGNTNTNTNTYLGHHAPIRSPKP